MANYSVEAKILECCTTTSDIEKLKMCRDKILSIPDENHLDITRRYNSFRQENCIALCGADELPNYKKYCVLNQFTK